jgi:hypothetical protein
MAKKPTEGRRKLVEFDAQTWHALNVLDDTANKMSGGQHPASQREAAESADRHFTRGFDAAA